MLEIEDAIDQTLRRQVDAVLEQGVILKRMVRSREAHLVRLINGETS